MLRSTHDRFRSGHPTHRLRTPLVALAIVGTSTLLLGAAPPSFQGPTAPLHSVPNELQELVDDFLDDLAEVAEDAAHDGARMTDPFDEAMIFLEENATDGDLGIHFKLDGDGWQRVKVRRPNGNRMVDIKVRGQAKQIGLTEIFSESAEPSFDEMPREEFLAHFPEGEYEFWGRTVEGDTLTGTATLTHTMPDQPVVLAPAEDDEVDPTQDLVVTWQTVGDPSLGGSVIEGYHLVIEKDTEGEPERVLAVDMLATDTTFTVPASFFESGKDYKVEIIVEETSGNKIITEVPFTTAAQ